MDEAKQVRTPKQIRSINLKEKILETALKLFCEKGYYKTTTNEIAKTAGISIGSLYSYFKDKDTIFLEILERYHKQFLSLHQLSITKIDVYKADKREWLRTLIESLVEIHEASKELNKELNVLYYSNPVVSEILDKQREETRQFVMNYFYLCEDDMKIKDLEAAAVLSFDFISAIVDRIVFGNCKIERERLLETGIDAIYKFLM